MPYINIRAVGEIATEKKAELIKEVTDVMSRVLGKDPSATYVVIDEVSSDNWGKGGKTVTEIRKGS